ncbi:MAG: PLD nuclease N-terminal domain-containing protein [Actinobacteria bacterium]|nr:PLD nuclease N-terminal domain-containing protein [Actinomycetota bacterium]
MIRLLPLALDLFLLVFCLVDCILADQARVRNLPKWGWVVLMAVIPLIGCIAWLVAGRPLRRPRPTPDAGTPATWEHPPYLRPTAPDDDPEFIAKLKRTNSEHERQLKRWEEDLRRREEELRQQEQTDTDPDDR